MMVGCSASRPRLRQAPVVPLETADEVSWWESTARPDTLGIIAVFVALVDDGGDGECPAVDESGNSTVVTGGCTDASGKVWTGKASHKTDGAVSRVRLRDFGQGQARLTGTVELEANDRPQFAMNLRMEGPTLHSGPDAPQWMALDVRGARETNGAWSGEGDLAAQGKGRVRMKAHDIMFDDKGCGHEPVAGRLELWSGEHHVVVDYDGATDCDPTGTARWSRDGVEQGELDVDGGLDCNPMPAKGSPPPVSGALLLLLGVGRRRVRRTPGD